jgi:cytochrome oxidase assembly protein ShyY1
VYRFLLTRRWVVLLVVAVLVAAGCVRLGFWQLHRLGERHARNDVITRNLGADPVPADRLLAVGRPLPTAQQWRPVRVQGRYDTGHELLVRNRPLEGAVGYYVLTPLVTGQGPALLVNRGWVKVGETAATRPDVPPAPSGLVTVTGRMRQSEPPSHGQAPPPGQVTRIDVPGIAKTLPYPVYGGFAEATGTEPAPGRAPQPIPPPEVDEGPHLAYAFQWFVFALIALGGFVMLARREAEGEGTPPPAPVPARVQG